MGVPVDDRSVIRRKLKSVPRSERRIVVIIPAYNEAASIQATIESVHAQTVQPTVIIVAANNCRDGTEDVARASGADVFVAEPNKQKKAGALNLTLNYVMRYLRNHDAVLIMDADTTLSDTFIETATSRLKESVGGVGGAFIGRESNSTIGTLQQMEYYRYRKDIVRNGERAFVLSGTGTLFSVKALRTVKASRDGRTLPKGDSFYDTFSLTEDNEITLALLACGYECISPAEMTTTTDVMESLGALWNQRDRWYLGALWNLRAFGLRMPWYMKLVYWKQQAGLLVSVLAFFLYVSLMALLIFSGATITWSPFWISLTVLVIVERVYSVWGMGWKARIFAGILVEQLYSILLCMIFFAALLKCIAGKKGHWVPT
jgi:cellulose synthase/poly-beta-1,6-N-acetylglucosamine synthase-like glycosyltransferase